MKHRVGLLAKLDCFWTQKKIRCFYFQPSPNQFNEKADTGCSSPVSLRPPWLGPSSVWCTKKLPKSSNWFLVKREAMKAEKRPKYKTASSRNEPFSTQLFRFENKNFRFRHFHTNFKRNAEIAIASRNRVILLCCLPIDLVEYTVL